MGKSASEAAVLPLLRLREDTDVGVEAAAAMAEMAGPLGTGDATEKCKLMLLRRSVRNSRVALPTGKKHPFLLCTRAGSA